MNITGRMICRNKLKIHDISISGISVVGDKRFETGKEYSLEIACMGKVLSVKGIVERATLEVTEEGEHGQQNQVYKAGIRFLDLSRDSIVELAKIIDRQKIGESKGSENGKLADKVHDKPVGDEAQEETIGSSFESYVIKKISLSGMLIESIAEIQLEERLSMELALPGHTIIHFLGRVVYSIKGPAGQGRYIGIEFIKMLETDKEKLRKFIKSLGSINSDYSLVVSVK
jgi:c-di-GMP-binding flagellar brake protein YcgR